MSALGSPTSPSSPPPFGRKTRSFARKFERCCCTIATYFPLAFIYSLTTWAAYVEAGIGLSPLPSGDTKSWTAKPSSLLALCLYILLNASYTTAVFTDPGSPSKPRNYSIKNSKGYSHLPTTEPSASSNTSFSQPITVSSTGAPRYCKKCHHTKPDRTHHCSTCKRCVLKMDHHCPWLATCVGLHNYKAFVLFLIYTTLFCWVCFFSTAWWVWREVLSSDKYVETFTPVNVILLAVISGTIGVVLTGFTGWHLWLCARGLTTIECLEKTRYLSGVRRRVERNRVEAMHHPYNDAEPHTVQQRLQRAGEAVLEFHANAIPGATRLEEGEERPSPTITPNRPSPHFPPTGPAQYPPSSSSPYKPSTTNGHLTPAQTSLSQTYASYEASRERTRYEDYLADEKSAKLPHAFDLGWRRNLGHLFGPKWWLWFLPVTNTTGDGWRWDVSEKWMRASQEQRHDDEEGRAQGGVGDSSGLRGGSSADGAPDLENGYPHSHSPRRRPSSQGALSLHTLKRPGRAVAKARQRRELDYGDSGEVESFEVSGSGSSDAESESSSSNDARLHGGAGDGWRRWE
jgi:palmitoyltransferase ZDHHC2/15/20